MKDWSGHKANKCTVSAQSKDVLPVQGRRRYWHTLPSNLSIDLLSFHSRSPRSYLIMGLIENEFGDQRSMPWPYTVIRTTSPIYPLPIQRSGIYNHSKSFALDHQPLHFVFQSPYLPHLYSNISLRMSLMHTSPLQGSERTNSLASFVVIEALMTARLTPQARPRAVLEGTYTYGT